MIFNNHEKLRGLHAFLGASQYHWINWNDDIFVKRFETQYSTEIGTLIHDLASQLINSKIRISENDKNLIILTLEKARIPRSCYNEDIILQNLIPFVNDAIGFHMSSEVILYYSDYCFGTTDCISFDEKTKTLRIHDYKSGTTPAHIEQLLIYASLFCLEYRIKPDTLKHIELRIYQNMQVITYEPKTQEIEKFMDIIKFRDSTCKKLAERDK